MKIDTGLNAKFYARFYASEASGRAHWIAEDLRKGRHDRLRDDFGALCKNVMELRAMLDVIAPLEEACRAFGHSSG